MSINKRVFIALSGGVDSSTAAAILLQRGYKCAGVFMITHDGAEKSQNSAQRAAEKLGIELHIIDLRSEFERIIEYFCKQYESGRTPNPCVVCNRTIKFGKLWEFAKSKGADLLATGHYARILPTPDGYGLFAAVDQIKDQSYALAMIEKKMLEHIILPIGQFTKTETRKIAQQIKLPTADSKESQEICFIPDNDYISFIENRCPELIRKGTVIDSRGQVLGEHNGIHRFTIGQRRGVRIAMGKPYYVVKVNAKSNTVTLGPKEKVMRIQLMARDVNWLIERPVSRLRAKVKIRYNAQAADATVFAEGNSAGIELDMPAAAITPGQLAAIYIQQGADIRVAGGGWIDDFPDL